MVRILPMASSIRPLSSLRFSNSSRFTSFLPTHRFTLHHLSTVVPQSHSFGLVSRCLKGESKVGRIANMAQASGATTQEDTLEWVKRDNRRMLHVVYRVGDMDRTIKFYTECLGMKLLRKRDIPEERYTNAFLGYGPEDSHFVIELTYNYGVDSYNIGSGFGHFGIAVDDVAKTMDLIKAKGGKVTREPGPVKGGSTVIAFIEDPDGYKFELLERGPTPEPLCQVMLRVGDLDRSINFYEKAFGMKLIRKRDNPEYKYAIAMMGYGPEDKSAVLELTYNYGITEYDKGNAYAQIAGTDDVYKTAEVIKVSEGKLTREPRPLPGINTKITACLDPDGWKTNCNLQLARSIATLGTIISFIIMNNIILVSITILSVFVGPSNARNPHIINFRSPNLYPESLTWDPTAQHFLASSLRYPTIVSVSDAGVVNTVISDQSLPPDSTFLGVSVDSHHNRLLAVVHSNSEIPPFNALATYDLRSGHRLFLTPLLDPASTSYSAGTNDVAVDFSGNAYVTNSASNFIWKVNHEGEGSVFSKSPVFTSHPVDPTTPYSSCGLNGIAYISKGYLLVVQSNTGKLFKVDAEDGTARRVLLNKDLPAADGMAVRSDGVVVAVSQHKAYYIKSDSSWSEGVVFDETALDAERFASSVTIGGEDRVYVLYGHVKEGMMGNSGREEFGIVEIDSQKESGEENIWVYLLIGFGLAYFFFWRFQMKQLVTNMNKKIA